MCVSRTGRFRSGFTLIEASLAVVIVGVGILASLSLFAACTRQNQASNRMTTALMLATNVQEAMAGLSFSDPGSATTSWGAETGETLLAYNDVDDFDGRTFNPPIDAMRAGIANLSQYTQRVTVMPIDPNTPGGNTNVASPTIPDGTYTGAVRVRVTVLYAARAADLPEQVLETSWIQADE